MKECKGFCPIYNKFVFFIEPLCDIKALAKHLKVSKNTVYKALMKGDLPAYRIEHQYRFKISEVENCLLQRGNKYLARNL